MRVTSIFLQQAFKCGAARLLTGVAAGVGLCVGPIYISEIAPSKIKGSVGKYTL